MGDDLRSKMNRNRTDRVSGVTMSSDPHHLLRIYVRDHHAASVAGVALAERCAREAAFVQ
jgi:hypothetical protein